eukprot:774987-Rhodomonas_salina.2
MSLHTRCAMPGTDLACGAVCLRACYAMSATGLASRAMRCPCPVLTYRTPGSPRSFLSQKTGELSVSGSVSLSGSLGLGLSLGVSVCLLPLSLSTPPPPPLPPLYLCNHPPPAPPSDAAAAPSLSPPLSVSVYLSLCLSVSLSLCLSVFLSLSVLTQRVAGCRAVLTSVWFRYCHRVWSDALCGTDIAYGSSTAMAYGSGTDIAYGRARERVPSYRPALSTAGVSEAALSVCGIIRPSRHCLCETSLPVCAPAITITGYASHHSLPISLCAHHVWYQPCVSHIAPGTALHSLRQPPVLPYLTCYAASGTDVAYSCTSLRVCYAQSGTELGGARATSLHHGSDP